MQGVGFRPHVYRLAHEMGISGWVGNDARGVVLEAEGEPGALERFLDRLRNEAPSPAAVAEVTQEPLPARGEPGFTIRASGLGEQPTAAILPDLATCPACLAEVDDPADRRHRYPFANCTHCGPRFSIIEGLPYDRPRTTMRDFALCPDCRREYDDPGDRRFHAQPNACPACGPALELRDAGGRPLARGEEALAGALAALADGRVVAVKGLGGFHLMADAATAAPLARLRTGKARREKPFALLVRDLDQARELSEVDAVAEALLTLPEAPIVLLPRRPDAPVHDAVAPGHRRLGLMLPANPLHHLLAAAFGRPLVATSGNLKDEPICTDENQAGERLGGLADLFLAHDRPIARHVDDSVVLPAAGGPVLLRRARGYAPRPLPLPGVDGCVLAVGAHQKATVALARSGQVVVSQHLGDMETEEALAAFRRTIDDFCRLYEAEPAAIAHDLHPDYASTRWARSEAARRGVPAVAVQHHHAHLAACLADAAHGGPVLGVTWDGTGDGGDGTVWGGEFLEGDASGFERVAHLRPFRLPGGAAAVREPRRVALALLHAMESGSRTGPGGAGADGLVAVAPDLAASFRPDEIRVLDRMLAGGFNSPVTTSAGRLFDGVAALLGLRQVVHEEGMAAVALEQAADPACLDAYELPVVTADGGLMLDWRPLLDALLADRRAGAAVATSAARFHNALAGAILAVARARDAAVVALTGGCFQNALLLQRTVTALEAAGIRVLTHRRVPPNDGGISLGQAAVAAARMSMTEGRL